MDVKTDERTALTSRIAAVDIAKGICILLVLLGHELDAAATYVTGELPMSMSFVKHIISGFHMPLFFFVAGLFAHRVKRDIFLSAIRGKAVRLLLPYFLWIFMLMLSKQCLMPFTGEPAGWRRLLLSPVQPFGQFWFLYTLFFIFMIYFIFGLLIIGKRFPIVFFIFSVGLWILALFTGDFWILRDLGTYTIIFAAGVLLQGRQAFLLRQLKRSTLPVMILFLLVNVAGTEMLMNWNGYAYKLLTGTVGTMFVLTLSVWIAAGQRRLGALFSALCFCGVHSMEFYCLHPFFNGLLRVIWRRFPSISFAWGGYSDRLCRDSLFVRTICAAFRSLSKDKAVVRRFMCGQEALITQASHVRINYVKPLAFFGLYAIIQTSFRKRCC